MMVVPSKKKMLLAIREESRPLLKSWACEQGHGANKCVSYPTLGRSAPALAVDLAARRP